MIAESSGWLDASTHNQRQVRDKVTLAAVDPYVFAVGWGSRPSTPLAGSPAPLTLPAAASL